MQLEFELYHANSNFHRLNDVNFEHNQLFRDSKSQIKIENWYLSYVAEKYSLIFKITVV